MLPDASPSQCDLPVALLVPPAALAAAGGGGVDGSADPARLAQLLGEVHEAVVHVDRDWVVRWCNDVYLEGLRLTRAEVVGRTPFEYLPNFDRSIFFDSIAAVRRDRRPMATIGWSAVLDRWLMVRVFPVADGGMLMLANDASDSVVRQHQLARQALKDELTGLGNKLALVQEIQRRIGAGGALSLAVLGLDRFAALNDGLGYDRGDRALMAIASRLQSATVEPESLFRLNGDEFAFVTVAEPALARARIGRLLDEARQPVVLEGHSFVLGARAGVARAPEHGTDAEELLKRALMSLRQAKRPHAPKVVVYEGALEAASRHRSALESQLREAIAHGRFALLLQPKGALDGRRVVGAEALIRWPHPERGLLAPDQFLPLAQECGLMPALDRWVLRQALAHVRALRAQGLEVPVAINLSVDSLSDSGFVDGVTDALRESGVEAAMLDIEIPEGALMRDVAASASVLAGLDALGVNISIDDFGTGYSSFAYLARFPVHTLKVDRSFVADMATSATSRAIVEALVTLAHSLAMRVVAEGTETGEQMTLLQDLRCDEMQGYGYGRPMALDAFCDFVRAGPQAAEELAEPA